MYTLFGPPTPSVSFIVVLGGDTLGYLQKFLQYIKYVIIEFIPFVALFHPPSSESQNILNRYNFYIYLHVYTLFTPPSLLVPPNLWAEPFPPACSLILYKKRIKDNKKNVAFC
jgi:hypothetical protein